ESVTWNTIADGSVNSGVPWIKPVAGSNSKPPGRRPEMTDHVYGGVPPVAVSVAEYGTPTNGVGRDVVVIVSAPPEIVSGRLTVAVWAGEPESVTLKLSGVALAVAVGVPEMTPLVVLNDRPAGSVPDVNCQL